MTSTYVPYSETAPKTTNLRELKAELDRVRAVYGRGSSQGAEAYNRLSHEAGKQGHPLDELRRHARDEAERFFAQVVPGPDGHHYWDGPRTFRRNDGHLRAPARWWWAHEHGPITTSTLRVIRTCDDTRCISPGHAKLEHMTAAQRHSDEQLLGALQVVAMRIGHTPNGNEFVRNGGRPTQSIYVSRFGSWENACRAAHLPAPTIRPNYSGPDGCIAALRYLHERLGRWPSTIDLGEHRRELQDRGLPAGETTFRTHLGLWREAIKAAQDAA